MKAACKILLCSRRAETEIELANELVQIIGDEGLPEDVADELIVKLDAAEGYFKEMNEKLHEIATEEPW